MVTLFNRKSIDFLCIKFCPFEAPHPRGTTTISLWSEHIPHQSFNFPVRPLLDSVKVTASS